MPAKIDRVVDAHVHHWDPRRTEWYPFLASDDALKEIGIDDVSPMRRYFDQETYLQEAGPWTVEKYVHVTAASTPNFVTETAELSEEATRTGHPDAIIGGIDPELSRPEIEQHLERQAGSPYFCGVRASAGMDHSSATARGILSVLQERDLIYDLVVHPPAMEEAARVLKEYRTLTVVVEHTGWPLSVDPDHVQQWRTGMGALADVGERVHCKLSGLAMTLNGFSVTSYRPWIEHCVEVFGVDRCFFASNFPVDGLFGTFDELYRIYDEVTSGLDDTARSRLFATNAERVYRC
jgi:predicted TIM-barrel fold metal-dependent hydrolase